MIGGGGAMADPESSLTARRNSQPRLLTELPLGLPGRIFQEGFQVLHLPIPDGGVPLRDQLEQTVTSIIQHAQAGQHLAIHCYAGIGRTGLVAAAVAMRLLGVPGEAAIAWVRHYIPRAVETPVQRQLLVDHDPGPSDSNRF
jgi:protein-tyrosine phosphatase